MVAIPAGTLRTVGGKVMGPYGSYVSGILDVGSEAKGVYDGLSQGDDVGYRDAGESVARGVGKAGAAYGSGVLAAMAGAAATGAVAGSVAPGIGTAIGLVTGAVVGGVVYYLGSETVDVVVEEGAELVTGKTDKQVAEAQELKNLMGSVDLRPNWFGGFMPGTYSPVTVDVQKGEYGQLLEDCKELERARKLAEMYPDNKAYADNVKAREKAALAVVKGQYDAQGNKVSAGIEDILAGLYADGKITLEQFTENKAKLDEVVKQNHLDPVQAQKEQKIAQEQKIQQESATNVKQALTQHNLGDGEVDAKDVANLQKILKASGFQAGEFGQNKDGVDSIRGKVTNAQLDAMGNGDGKVDAQDIQLLAQKSGGQLDGKGNYHFGKGDKEVVIPANEYHEMLSDFTAALGGKGTTSNDIAFVAEKTINRQFTATENGKC